MMEPVFIVGCGRSGTTILGKALSMHSKIKYLNEPRHIWSAAYPTTDIWGASAVTIQAKLKFTGNDATPEANEVIRKRFLSEIQESGKSILIEKLPINSFRLGLIRSIFPRARFIHVLRNGRDVGKSIQELCDLGKWFTANNHKWNLLAEYAQQTQETAHLPALCSNYYLKGLLEWRLSVSEAGSFLSKIPENEYVCLRYEELVRHPRKTISRVLDFLDLQPEVKLSTFAREKISERTHVAQRGLTELEARIGGELLAESIWQPLSHHLLHTQQFAAGRRP